MSMWVFSWCQLEFMYFMEKCQIKSWNRNLYMIVFHTVWFRWSGWSINLKVGSLIPGSSSPNLKVSLSEMPNSDSWINRNSKCSKAQSNYFQTSISNLCMYTESLLHTGELVTELHRDLYWDQCVWYDIGFTYPVLENAVYTFSAMQMTQSFIYL